MVAKNKEDFLSQLRGELHRIGVDADEDIFADFEEHFMASAKEGLSEEETCRRLGDVKEIARNYINIESSRINSIVAQAIEADRPHVSLTKPGRDVPADLSLLDKDKKSESKPLREYTPEHFSEEIYPNAKDREAPRFTPEHAKEEQNVPPKADEAAQTGGMCQSTAENGDDHSGQSGQGDQSNQPLADALGAAGSAVAEAAKIAGKAVASAFNTDSVKNAGKNAADAMKNAGHAFADAMKTSAENIRAEAREARQNAHEAAREARQEAREAARDARHEAHEAAREARQAAREARHEFSTESGRAYHEKGKKVYEFYGGEDVMPDGVPHSNDSFRSANSYSRVGEVPPQSCPPVGSGKASKYSDLKGRKMNPSFGKLFGCIMLDVFLWSWLLCLLVSIVIGFGSVCLGLVGSGISTFCGAFDYNVISSIFLGLGQISLGGIFAGFTLLMVKAVIALVKSIIWQHVKALYDI